MKCPNCNSELDETTIEGRKRLTCKQCKYLEYEGRTGRGGAYELIVDEIIDDIVNKGSHETMGALLANTAFREKGSINRWCNFHGFTLETFDKKDAEGKVQQFVRFTRRT